jgi:type I restriction enzyme S subunit
VRRLRHVARPRVEKTTAGSLPHVDLADVAAGGTGHWEAREGIERDTDASLAWIDDVAVAKLRPYLRKGFLVDRPVSCSTEFIVLEPVNGCDPRFLWYCLLSREFTAFAQASVEGAKMPRTSWDAVRDFRFPELRRDEQRRIARFLDRECTRMGELLSNLVDLLELETEALEWRREKLIMGGDSHMRLKFALMALVDTEHATCPVVDSGDHLVIRTSAVRDGLLDEEGCYPTDDGNFAAWTRRRLPRPGDVVLTREAPAGEAAIIPPRGSWCLGQRCVLLVLDRQRLVPEFVVSALYGRSVRDEIALRSRSTTAAHLNVEDIPELRLPMPSIEAQRQAMSEFAASTTRYRQLEAEIGGLRDALAEYRDALITEAVTGKLDVSRASEARMAESLDAVRQGEPAEVLRA